MSVATRARRLAAPVGRPLRRAAVGLRTRDWPPHSHLFIAQEGADWVLAHEARQLAKLAAGLGVPVGPEGWVNAVAGQARLMPAEPITRRVLPIGEPRVT